MPEMTLVLVGVVTAEGIGKMLDPTLNSMEAVSRFLLLILAERNMLSVADEQTDTTAQHDVA